MGTVAVGLRARFSRVFWWAGAISLAGSAIYFANTAARVFSADRCNLASAHLAAIDAGIAAAARALAAAEPATTDVGARVARSVKLAQLIAEQFPRYGEARATVERCERFETSFPGAVFLLALWLALWTTAYLVAGSFWKPARVPST